MPTRKLLLLAAAAALLSAAPAPGAAQTVRAGMTEAQVRSALGEPAATRRSDDGWSYLFYLNGCAARCGSDDVVFLRGDRVVTAVFRTPRRRFAGPAAAAALEGGPGAPARPAAAGGARLLGAPRAAAPPRATEAAPGQATVTGIRVTLPGSEDVSLGAGGAAPAPGRSGIIVYPSRPEREAAVVPGQPRGAIIIRDALGTEVVRSDTALDRTRQERERRVVPRTVRPDDRGAPVADSTMTPATRERERAVAPRTVRPRPR